MFRKVNPASAIAKSTWMLFGSSLEPQGLLRPFRITQNVTTHDKTYFREKSRNPEYIHNGCSGGSQVRSPRPPPALCRGPPLPPLPPTFFQLASSLPIFRFLNGSLIKLINKEAGGRLKMWGVWGGRWFPPRKWACLVGRGVPPQSIVCENILGSY